jgi:hypothetical protein
LGDDNKSNGDSDLDEPLDTVCETLYVDFTERKCSERDRLVGLQILYRMYMPLDTAHRYFKPHLDGLE